MKIFWSWQSDRDPKLHHYFVRDALKDACKLIASDPDYEEANRPEVDHDTKNVAGTPDITSTILGKIASANVFVADMTPVGMTDPALLQPGVPSERRSEPKYLQNPNVMSELGYAERAVTQDRIILVANRAHYPGPEALPFDWRHRSGAKTYLLTDGASREEIAAERKRFADVLKACIQPILTAQTPAKAPPETIQWQPASETDVAVWRKAEEGLKFRNGSLQEPQRVVRLAEGKRIYARIAPAEWQQPPRSDLETRVNRIGLVVRSRDGDWGLNADGAISVWGKIGSDRNAMDVWNATQWFQKTGEIWAVNTNAFTEHNGRLWFSSGVLFEPLENFLGNGIAAIREMGGKGPIGIKLGALDIGDTVLPANQYSSNFIEAVGSEAEVVAEASDWQPAMQRDLLLRFWNQIMDVYGQAPVNLEQFQRAVGLLPLRK